ASSPAATSVPKPTATGGSSSPAVVVCATPMVINRPAAVANRTGPASNPRQAGGESIMSLSLLRRHLDGGRRVVVVLDDGLDIGVGGHKDLGRGLPALAFQGFEERLHHGRVELAARA